jgi:hypothetical protein
MQRQTIQTNQISTLSWTNNYLIDWANSGRQYFTNGQVKELGSYYFAFSFDSAITSEDGIYSVIYKKLGTKGLLRIRLSSFLAILIITIFASLRFICSW